VSGALESSVTLDDVFVVVGAKRVPLAPELAGYLALEVAEGAAQAAGEVDPQRVYIGEEGSVALVVRPRRDAREPQPGDAEASVRAILAKLLEASGSQTPALGGVARRRGAQGGLPGLVEELEAALIPVNRAAGRRALARLAREVKRVTLQIGRNASLAPSEPAPRRASSPSYSAAREPAPVARVQEPPLVARVLEPPPVARIDGPPARAQEVAPRVIQEQTLPLTLPLTRLSVEEPQTTATRERAAPPPPKVESSPDASELPTIEVRKEQLVAAFAARSNPPPAVAARSEPRVEAKRAQVDEVDHLLASFAVSHHGEQTARNELKALVGLEPTPPPPGSEHAYDEPEHAPRESDVESLLNMSDAGPPVVSRPIASSASAPMSPPQRALASPPTAISPQLANEPYAEVATVASAQHPPASVREPRPSRDSFSDGPRAAPTSPSARKLADLSSFRPPRAPGTDRTLSVFALVILGAGAAAIYVLKPAFFSGRESPPPPPASAVAAASAAVAASAPRCHASIIVTNAPQNSEVLLRVGQAPVDVDHMPAGAPLEFVATAEGFAPKRVVIPAGAAWDTGTDGKPRFEAAVQLDKSRARPGSVDNWPPGEPGSEVGGKGPPGTVHLVATPHGAEMWMLAGLGPDARIDELTCGGDVDVLIAGPTTLRKRLHVAESSFTAVDGGSDREATVSAK
jgi:hypothetical protein